MSVSEEVLSPQEAKLKFQSQADLGMAQQLQEEEFSHLREGNMSNSQTRHQTVTVGSKVAAKVALQEDTINKIVETERLKREEMDRKLASKFQDKESSHGDQSGVQTWLSRELIGFEHTKNRLQERRDEEQLAQQLQDEEMAVALQEKDDRDLARDLEEKSGAEEASARMALALSRPDTFEPIPAQFFRAGSEGKGRGKSPTHIFAAINPRDSQMPRSKTFTTQVSSPNLRPSPVPLPSWRPHASTQRLAPEPNHFRAGKVPGEGHPFVQTPADQQLFKEREHGLVAKSKSLNSPKRSDPPPYAKEPVRPSVPPSPPVPPVPFVSPTPVTPPVPPVPFVSPTPVTPPVVPTAPTAPVPPTVPTVPVVPSVPPTVPTVPIAPPTPITPPVAPSVPITPPIAPSVPITPPVAPSVPITPPVAPSVPITPPVAPSVPITPPVAPSVPITPPVAPSVPITPPVAPSVPITPPVAPPVPITPPPTPSTPGDTQTDQSELVPASDTPPESDQSEEATPPPPPPFSGAAPSKLRHNKLKKQT